MAIQKTMTIRLGGRPFRLVIFDMDGVLVSTSASHAKAYEELWSELGLDGPDYDSIAGRRTGEVVAEVADSLQPSAEQVGVWTLQKQRRARELISVDEICYPDAADCLKCLSENGAVLALGTAASGETARMLLDRYGLSGLFAMVVTAEDVKNGKPAPDIYQQIIAMLGIPAIETLVVEDSLSGLQSALLAGACAVSVRTGIRQNDENFLGAFDDLHVLQQATRAGQ